MEGLECMELTFGNGMVESLWVRIKGQTTWTSSWESAIDHLARTMILMNCSLRN